MCHHSREVSLLLLPATFDHTIRPSSTSMSDLSTIASVESWSHEPHTIANPRDDVGFLTSKHYPKSFQKTQSATQKTESARVLALLDALAPSTPSLSTTTAPTSGEQLILAIKVTKINRKGKRQQRLFVLTNLAIYNYKVGSYSAAKRRIDLMHIESIHVNTENVEEFILKVPSEYDYRFESTEKPHILSAVQRAWGHLNQVHTNNPSNVLPLYNLDGTHINVLLKNAKSDRHFAQQSFSSSETSGDNAAELLGDNTSVAGSGSGSRGGGGGGGKQVRNRRSSVSDFIQGMDDVLPHEVVGRTRSPSSLRLVLQQSTNNDFTDVPRSEGSVSASTRRTSSVKRRRMSMRNALLDKRFSNGVGSSGMGSNDSGGQDSSARLMGAVEHRDVRLDSLDRLLGEFVKERCVLVVVVVVVGGSGGGGGVSVVGGVSIVGDVCIVGDVVVVLWESRGKKGIFTHWLYSDV